jgi:X-Pro dipeptidyl-peptidase
MSKLVPLVIVLAFSAAAFAGCVENDPVVDPRPQSPVTRRAVDPSVYESRLSKELFGELIQENVRVPSFDGKEMDNWVYRPKTDEATKVPVFINFSPYWGNLAPPAGLRGDAFSQYMIDYFVPRGYAVVLSSVRGTGDSAGCFNIGGDIEKRDAVAVIEHFAAQPWSNGNVGAGGKSYDGTTANAAAVMAPPALKMIFPVSGISELYKYNSKGGLAFTQGPIFNTYYYALVGVGVPLGGTPQVDPAKVALYADDAACADLVNTQGQGVGSGVTGDYTAYWTERNYTKDASKVTAAVFFVHGFTDWNVKPDHILPFINAIPESVPKKVWLHNWTASDASSDGHVYPRRDDWNLTMLRFMDQTLKGIDTGIFDEPAFQIQDSEGTWRWEEAWPPARAAGTKFYLGFDAGKGALDPTAPFRSGVRVFEDNGQGPAGTTTTGTTFLRYETQPLEYDVHYAGVPRLHVQASTNEPIGKIVATLYDVSPEGNARLINWGGLNFRHRLALENPQPVVPNEVYSINIELFPQDDVVRAGHKLVLMLAGGGGGFLNQPTQARISVVEDEKAFLELPLITTVALEDPQPIQIPCFAC